MAIITPVPILPTAQTAADFESVSAETLYIGVNPDYLEVSATGQVTLHGDARVVQHLNLPLFGIGLGANAPTATRLGNTFGYAFTVGDDGYTSMELPADWDSTTALSFAMHVYTNATTGNIRFKADWTAVAENVDEAVDAPTHSGTMTGNDLAVSTTAKGMQEYTLGTIAAASLSADDQILLKIERIARSGGSDPGGGAEPVVMTVECEYTVNLLGEPV